MRKAFKAQLQTRRFKQNQIIWVTYEHQNHLNIRYRFRGKGRYVNGFIDKFDRAVGELFEVD